MIIAAGLLVGVALYILVNRTRVGMLVRAGSTHREMVRALGVNIRLLYTLVFGLGALLAGFAGLMTAPLLAVQVGMGEQILILTFVVVVIGGVGSVRGAFFGALMLALSIRCFAPSAGAAAQHHADLRGGCAGGRLVVDRDLYGDGARPAG